MASKSSESSRRRLSVWLLQPFHDDYKSEKYSDPKKYYVYLREEWKYILIEQKRLVRDLIEVGVCVPHLRSRTMLRRNMVECELAVTVINKENNRMLMRRSRYFMLQLVTEMDEATGK